MRYSALLISAAVLACISFASWAQTSSDTSLQPAPAVPADVRMIIDISGSMKKTDPHNLRRPAVDLMLRLLPENSKAGIWTFGQSVNMLMPHRLVDESWRAQALTSAKTINSIAMYTNIGEALVRATEDASAVDAGFRRNLVLLTDGVVDIGPEAVLNINERKRILNEILPQLRAAGYVVHTIALSSDADQELMKKLAQSTDGVFAVADSAEELMQAFLQIFDQAVPAERLPLEDNGFVVDASVQEFTALIFRKADVPFSVIVAPDGREFSDTDSQQKVTWYKTDSYDLITVQQPAVGQWRVKTEMAPNSRVTVVSNLQLQVAALKTQIKVDQPLALAYSFAEDQETITKPEFLNLLSAQLLVTPAQGEAFTRVLASEAVPGDGVFRHQLPGFAPGNYQLRLTVDGKTFKREFVHQLQVNESAFKLDKQMVEQNGQPAFVYRLSADAGMVEKGSAQVSVLVDSKPGESREQALENNDESWEFVLTPAQPAHYRIRFKAKARAIDDTPIMETLVADDFYFPDEASVLAAQQPAAAVASSEASSEAAVAPVVESPGSNLWLYVGIGVANLLVLMVGFVAYRMIKSSKQSGELESLEKNLKNETGKNKPGKKASEPVAAAIDLSEPEGMAEMADMSLPQDDQGMADNLFPLDNLEDDSSKKN